MIVIAHGNTSDNAASFSYDALCPGLFEGIVFWQIDTVSCLSSYSAVSNDRALEEWNCSCHYKCLLYN